MVVFVGVVLPKGGNSGTHFFDLCQGEDCVKAGEISVFGGDDPKDKYVTLQGGVNDDDFYLAGGRFGGVGGGEVTDLMIEQGWSFKKPLVAKMTGSDTSGDDMMEKYWYLNLPEPVPVVILEWKVGRDVLKRQFILNPKEKRRNYGNLLDKYN